MSDIFRVMARHSSDIILATLVTVIAFDYGALPAVLLATKMNVFIIPVAVTTTGVFDFPAWVWYILSIRWVGQAAVRFGVGRDELHALAGRLRPSGRGPRSTSGDGAGVVEKSTND